MDGHYSGGSTALSDVPILAELAAVLGAPIDHVVLIDDARLFDGTDGYPRLVDVLDDVRTRWPNCTVEVINDMVRIHR